MNVKVIENMHGTADIQRVCLAFAMLFSMMLCNVSLAQNPPPINPYLTDSYWPTVHGVGGGSASYFQGPVSKNRQLKEHEMTWKSLGQFDLTTMAYSGPYPDGRRTLVIGTIQHLIKMDADTLETLSTYVLRPGKYITADESNQLLKRYDELAAEDQRQELIDLAAKYVVPQITGEQLGNTFTSLTRDNERLMYVKDPYSDRRYFRYIGDAIAGDASSDLVMKRQWELPTFNNRPFIPFGSGLTYDGWIVAVSDTGMMLALSNDYKQHTTLDLNDYADNSESAGRSFMRNGIVIDDNNGVYVNTSEFIARVQWTGSELSLDPQQGAWIVNYAKADEKSGKAASGAKGSGTTPTLMGWGEEEDHLVVIANGDDEDPKMMVLWRDEIPDDWKGIPGYHRRVAGVAPVMYQGGIKAPARVENSPQVMGYGIFTAAELPSKPAARQDSPPKQWLANRITASLPGTEGTGGIKWIWDPDARELKVDWITPLKLAQSLCTPSINGILYCMGIRDSGFTLEGLDWETGKSKHTYKLGKSLRFFANNNMVVAPNGAIDVYNWLGMGINRMQPDP